MTYELEEKQVSGPWLVKVTCESEELARRIFDLIRFDNMFTTWRIVQVRMVIAPQHANGIAPERTVIE